MMSALLRACLVLALPTSAWASTWIVDDDGGPGVDFTSITAAVAVAAPGDVILVRPGSYPGFTLTSGVLVLGESGVAVTSHVAILGVGPGPRASIARMVTRTIRVADCAAPITIEDVTAVATGAQIASTGDNAPITIDNCDDARMRGVSVAIINSSGSAEVGLSVQDSRLEITHSTFRGVDGYDSMLIGTTFYPPTSGGDGISIAGVCDVHVSLTTAIGGDGGDVEDSEWNLHPGGDAGNGIRVQHPGTRLLVTGVSTNRFVGGAGGIAWWSPACYPDGESGNGVRLNGATARMSGVTFVGGYRDCGPPAPGVDGPYQSPNPPDPSLAVDGNIAQGQVVTYTLRGAPGSAARLRLGRQLVVQDLPDAWEDRLTIPLRTYDLGTVPASGQVTFDMLLSPALAPGFVLVAQASTVSQATGVALTQSVPITVH